MAGFMVVMCLVMAYFLLFSDLLIERLYGFKRHLFVALILVYGLYRAFRLYTLIQNNKKEEQ
jgi:hypothetical protein